MPAKMTARRRRWRRLGLLPAATRDLPAVGGFQPAQRVKKLTLYEQKKEKNLTRR